ncbi:hypothetical protein QQ045_016810 [Rhodiola kirilowii]
MEQFLYHLLNVILIQHLLVTVGWSFHHFLNSPILLHGQPLRLCHSLTICYLWGSCVAFVQLSHQNALVYLKEVGEFTVRDAGFQTPRSPNDAAARLDIAAAVEPLICQKWPRCRENQLLKVVSALWLDNDLNPGCLQAPEELHTTVCFEERSRCFNAESMKAKIGLAVVALDSLLKTVPTYVFDKGKAIADAYRTSDENTEIETSDKELKQLESIL